MVPSLQPWVLIAESQNHSGWKRPPTSQHATPALSAASPRLWDTSRDEDCPTSCANGTADANSPCCMGAHLWSKDIFLHVCRLAQASHPLQLPEVAFRQLREFLPHTLNCEPRAGRALFPHRLLSSRNKGWYTQNPNPRGNYLFGLFPIETLPAINSWRRSRADRAPRSEPCGLSVGGIKHSAPGLPVLGCNTEAKSLGGHSGWLEMER